MTGRPRTMQPKDNALLDETPKDHAAQRARPYRSASICSTAAIAPNDSR